MKILELGQTMSQCPVYWANFVSEIMNYITPYDDVPMSVINRELAKFNARYILAGPDDNSNYVEFDSDKDLSFFILRWS